MKIEFEFDDYPESALPVKGVAILYSFDASGAAMMHYGVYADPTSLDAVGLYTAGLELAKEELLSGDEVEGS